jgi:hypothetical protein
LAEADAHEHPAGAAPLQSSRLVPFQVASSSSQCTSGTEMRQTM